MRRMGYFFSLVVVLLAALAGFGKWTGLNVSVPHAAERSDSGRLKQLNAEIEKEIGTPTATEPKQCKLIGFGSKPCGGPARYLVYSTAKTDEARLKQLVNEYNQLQEKIKQEKKLVSDCMFVTEPKVEFVGGVCTTSRN